MDQVSLENKSLKLVEIKVKELGKRTQVEGLRENLICC